MRKNLQDKLATIQDLLRQREMIDKRLESLLDSSSSITLPDNFVLNEKILELLETHPHGLSASLILRTLQNNHPTVQIKRKQVAGSLSYLKNRKGKIVTLGRGSYTLKQLEGSEADEELETAGE